MTYQEVVNEINNYKCQLVPVRDCLRDPHSQDNISSMTTKLENLTVHLATLSEVFAKYSELAAMAEGAVMREMLKDKNAIEMINILSKNQVSRLIKSKTAKADAALAFVVSLEKNVRSTIEALRTQISLYKSEFDITIKN